MAKHRKEGFVHGVMVLPLYFGEASKESVGKIILTEGERAVISLDPGKYEKSLTHLLTPKGGLTLGGYSDEVAPKTPTTQVEYPWPDELPGVPANEKPTYSFREYYNLVRKEKELMMFLESFKGGKYEAYTFQKITTDVDFFERVYGKFTQQEHYNYVLERKRRAELWESFNQKKSNSDSDTTKPRLMDRVRRFLNMKTSARN